MHQIVHHLRGRRLFFRRGTSAKHDAAEQGRDHKHRAGH
jgi:hypothetical protein